MGSIFKKKNLITSWENYSISFASQFDCRLSLQNTAVSLKFANTDTNFLFITVRLAKGKQNRQ